MKIAFFKETVCLFYASIRTTIDFMHGLWVISRLKMPMVTIFGGTRVEQDSLFAQQAQHLAQLLVQNGFSVVTGGGPGVMQAANCGAASVLKKKGREIRRWTLGIGVKGVDDEFINPCAPVLKLWSFFTRKWFLSRYSMSFVIFPGGIGTANELFEVLNLLKHKKIESCSIILVDKTFWQPLNSWFTDSAFKSGFIAQNLEHVFTVCESSEEAFKILRNAVSKD